MAQKRDVVLGRLEAYLQGMIAYHHSNFEVYLNNPAGIGEHPDIMGAMEEELGKLAEYQEKLAVLENTDFRVW